MNQKASSADKTGEQHEFQAEVSKLLHLMVHSVYSEKEVFLRELISNGSDACDKLRYEALTKPDLIDGDQNFKIVITVNKKKRLIHVADNGIGMDRQELIDNLGTIARSGTSTFVEQLSGDEAKDAQLIGRFGVGFYSTFMVADKVDVASRTIGSDEVYHWASDGAGAFAISQVEDATDLLDGRGTRVSLHIRKGDDDYLDPVRLRGIVKNYSDHIAIPIFVVDENDKEAASDAPVNSASALWMRAKSDITDDQYTEFYHHVGHVFDEPWMRIHYKAEGRNEYNVLLFVPSSQPLDLFDPKRATRVKLYVQRVFITEDAELLPSYLRFVRGVVDSEDMPLNMSREMLQNNPIVHRIRNAVTKRVLNELKKKADKKPEDFEKFWSVFGAVLKEGIYEDFERREQLLDMARFRSTKGEGWRTLKDYMADMAENQTAIYYIHGEDAAAIAKSPQLEGYLARNIEVLLLTDPVDAFWTAAVPEYDGKPIKSVSRGTADLDTIAKKATDKESDKESHKKDDGVRDATIGTLIALFKQTLGDDIADVRRSDRLTESPVCLVAAEGSVDAYLERVLAASQGGAEEAADPMKSRILEINPDHALIRSLAAKISADGARSELEDAAYLLLDHARIIEGAPVIDPAAYTRRLASMMEKGLSL